MHAKRRRHRTKAYHWYRRRRAGASEIYIRRAPAVLRELERIGRREMRILAMERQSAARAHPGVTIPRVSQLLRRVREAMSNVLRRHAR